MASSLTWVLRRNVRCNDSTKHTLSTYLPSRPSTLPLLRRTRTLPHQGTSLRTLSHHRLEQDQWLWKKPPKEEGPRKGSSSKTANRRLRLAAHHSHHRESLCSRARTHVCGRVSISFHPFLTLFILCTCYSFVGSRLLRPVTRSEGGVCKGSTHPLSYL